VVKIFIEDFIEENPGFEPKAPQNTAQHGPAHPVFIGKNGSGQGAKYKKGFRLSVRGIQVKQKQ
jgi:hypothetical protein